MVVSMKNLPSRILERQDYPHSSIMHNLSKALPWKRRLKLSVVSLVDLISIGEKFKKCARVHEMQCGKQMAAFYDHTTDEMTGCQNPHQSAIVCLLRPWANKHSSHTERTRYLMIGDRVDIDKNPNAACLYLKDVCPSSHGFGRSTKSTKS